MKTELCSTSVGPGHSLTMLRDCKKLKPIKQAKLALKVSSRFTCMLLVLRKQFPSADPDELWQAGLVGKSPGPQEKHGH